jgi:hypothetical protein
MPVYRSTEELHKAMKDLWTRIAADSGMSTQLLQSRLIVQFHYREPDGRVTIDCSDGETLKVYTGEAKMKAVVEMFMKSDIAHEFWLGKVSVPVAILTGKIVSKGPVNKALALLPVIKPAFAIYPSVIENLGIKTTACRGGA